jgi:RNA polymerase subunit RPABC4/transcription elongation factor Spt4
MKKLPDRFICEKCSYISTKDYLVCPACDNGMVREYSSDESKESQK